jgi:hypothetical protein
MRCIKSVTASPTGRPGVRDAAAYVHAASACLAFGDSSANSVAAHAAGEMPGFSTGRANSQDLRRASAS